MGAIESRSGAPEGSTLEQVFRALTLFSRAAWGGSLRLGDRRVSLSEQPLILLF